MNWKVPDRYPKFHRKAATIAASPNRTQVAKRRSNRMLLKASIGLSGEDRLKCSFTMTATAIRLNRHGAVVQLSRDLAVGSVVLLRNKRGTEIPARIVGQLTATNGVSSYGIEFVERDERSKDFWGLTFPSTA